MYKYYKFCLIYWNFSKNVKHKFVGKKQIHSIYFKNYKILFTGVEWKPTIVYSKNALVWLDHKYYAAVISSVNENPKTAGEEFWKELGK